MDSPTPLNEVMASLERVHVCLRSLEEIAGEKADKTAHQIAVLATYELGLAQQALESISSQRAVRK